MYPLPVTQNCGLRMRRECRERFPRHRFQRKLLVSYPGMHHVTRFTQIPWCMSGSLNRGGEENVPGIPGACATHNFMYLVRGPCHQNRQLCVFLAGDLSAIIIPQSNLVPLAAKPEVPQVGIVEQSIKMAQHRSKCLIHWDRDKMAAILQTTFWDAFSWTKMYDLRSKFNWSLFLKCPALVQIMAWHRPGEKPLSDTINDGYFSGAYMRHSASMS